MRPRLFYYKADAGGDSGSSKSVIDEAFGQLSGIRPDLANDEARELERKQAGKSPKRSLETGSPLLDSQREPGDGVPETVESETETKPSTAARETLPADDDLASGSDPESPDDEDAVLDALVEKYQGKPKSMAKAIRGIRSLQTKTAEEKKVLEDQVDAITNVIDRDYDWVDGKPVLKPEVAARALRNSNGRGKAGSFNIPSESDIRSEVTEEFRKAGEDVFNEDQMPAYLLKYKPLIDSQVSERMKTAKIQAETFRYNMLAEVGNVVERHLREHPSDKEIIGDIDAMYAGVPEELRPAAVLEEWIPFGKVAELVRVKAKLPAMIKEAYELGKKHRGEAGKVTESGSPGRSRPAPTTGRGNQSEAVKALKDGMMRGSGLPSIDDLFA